ncbi:putative SAM-dependent methyltransferase [Bradyrhizobium diazoefficiens]
MQRPRKPIAGGLPTTRSRVTNGTQLLIGVDGRSPAARRFRDLIRAYEQDYHITSEADRNLARQAATLALKSEQCRRPWCGVSRWTPTP